MEASRGPPRVKNKAPGKYFFSVSLTIDVLKPEKLLSKLAQSNSFARLSIVKSPASKHLPSASPTSRSFMNSKAGKGKSLRTMCEGIG